MRNSVLLLIFLFWVSNNCIAQNNNTESIGESPVHKKSDNAKALNEAIMDAQTNAVINYGSNIRVLNVSKREYITESKKGIKDKTYKTSGNYSSNKKFLLQNSISAMVKNIDIKSDTVWINKNKFKVRVEGKFDVNLKDLDSHITTYLNNTDRKIKIEVKENDCFGQTFKPMSEYMNSRKNNFFFSSQPWLLGEGDFKIEINPDRAVLYDKRVSPNIAIKIYSYKNCQSLISKQNEENKLLDEIMSDMYSVYIYKSAK